jgi:hypothetical protein
MSMISPVKRIILIFFLMNFYFDIFMLLKWHPLFSLYKHPQTHPDMGVDVDNPVKYLHNLQHVLLTHL